MPFTQLTDRLNNVFRRLKARGKLSERDVDEAVRQIKLALLEADVNYKVVKDFVARVRERAVGREVLASVAPGQQVVKIVHDEMARLMGGERAGIAFAPRPPSVIMLVGLHGSGKTTTAAKLARHLSRQGRLPLLIAADLRRPAARDQLAQLGRSHGLPVWTGPTGFTPPEPDSPEAVRATLDIITSGLSEARTRGCDVVIIDTGGRFHVDEALMEELKKVREVARPAETLLVLDAMTGQEAVGVAETFSREVGIDGVVLTKLDGDARGGAALSVRAVTGRPIKFVGTGEKIDDLEPFHPDRMASRILDMGDIVTLVERAEAAFDAEKARELERKLRRDEFTLDDFLDQLRQVRKMGSLQELLSFLPGVGRLRGLKGLDVDEKQFGRVEAIICSMTREERRDPSIIDGSRRRRIAAGSGTTTAEVNRLLRQFSETRKLIKRLTAAGKDARGLSRLMR
ncbi:MAG TPA: signal recognition particle protein [Clostridiales bacterium]|nr:signal recognition particle protein [Clostridiales bacterium]